MLFSFKMPIKGALVVLILVALVVRSATPIKRSCTLSGFLDFARREPIPNIINPPANDHLLEQLENQEIQSMFEQNTQHGFGITQMTAADTTIF